MKKIFLIIIIATLLFQTYGFTQEARKEAGVRSGIRGGLFFQVTSEAGNAEIGYNAMLGFNNNGIQLTGLRIIYETSISSISPDLYFAWGYGGHAGFIVTDHISYFGERYSFTNDRFCPVFGADGWVAAEYRFREIPLKISVNIKPYVELTIPAFVRIMPVDIGISVSYVF
jgi:hypothetical protein